MNHSVIYVQYKDGSKASGTRISLGFSAGVSRESYTDGQGMAVVEHASTGQAEVYVSGMRKGSFHAPGTFAVTL